MNKSTQHLLTLVFMGLILAPRSSPAQLEPQPGQKQLQPQKAPVVTKNPELLESVAPEYPEAAQKEGIENP